MTGSELIWLLIAFVCALSLPFGLRPILRHIGVVDVPNDRSSHTRSTLRGGGLAPLLAFGVGSVPVLLADPFSGSIAWVVVVPAVAVGLVGLLEDVRGLPISARAGAQLLLGFGVSAGCVAVFDGPVWSVALAAFAFAAYVNVANFMDGVNGISGLHGAVAGGAYALLGMITGFEWLLYFGFLIAVVFAAFLPWNLSSRGLFLGDVGSYFLGGGLAALCLASLYAGVNPIAAIAPLAIYLADAGSTMARRGYRGEPILRPHRAHAYQRLTDTGLSHLAVAVIAALATAVAAAVGLLVQRGAIGPALGLGLVLTLCVVYLVLPRARGAVIPPRRTYSLPDPSPAEEIPARRYYQPRRFAVLGASGFVGSALTRTLRAEGVEVTSVHAPRLELDPGERDRGAIAQRSREIAAADELAIVLSGFDVVINAAGLANPDDAGSVELYGANALLPAVVATAAIRANVARVIHISSAAVQGRRPILDESPDVSPFSPYSMSKALGEGAFLAAREDRNSCADLIVVRATSVQGPGRQTTASLRRVAFSPLSSVSAPGNQPTVVSSIDGLTAFISAVSRDSGAQSSIRLQPWEGLSVADVLQLISSRRPVTLPRFFCRSSLRVARAAGRVIPEFAGLSRRLELMWMGQEQVHTVLLAGVDGCLEQILRGEMK